MESNLYKELKTIMKKSTNNNDPLDPMVKLGVIEDTYDEEGSEDIMDKFAG